METERDDKPGNGPLRRLRVDEFAPVRPAAAAGAESAEGPAHSGRRVVTLWVVVLLLLWGTLYVVFRDWRARYRVRAEYGATQVAPMIDPLAELVPPGVEAADWRAAVAETHAMLVTLTAANLLDLRQMQALRADVAARVKRARAHPDSARAELSGLWNDLAAKAGPILTPRHPRPRLLPPAPEAKPRARR